MRRRLRVVEIRSNAIAGDCRLPRSENVGPRRADRKRAVDQADVRITLREVVGLLLVGRVKMLGTQPQPIGRQGALQDVPRLIRLAQLRQRLNPVSYTHLDVYKRQEV